MLSGVEAERKCAGPCTGLSRQSISFLETPGNLPQPVFSMSVLYFGKYLFSAEKNRDQEKKDKMHLDKENLDLMMVTFYEVGMSGFLLYHMKKRS